MEREQRWTYAAVAVLFGLPGLLAGGTFSVLMVAELPSDPRGGAWGLAGLVGLLSWLWLSGLYLWKGAARLSLRTGGWMPRLLWPGVAVGALATLPVLWIIWHVLAEATTEQGTAALQPAVFLFVFGPSILVPVALLVWLVCRGPRAGARPA